MGWLSTGNLRDQGWKEFPNVSRPKQSRQVFQPLLERGTPSPQGDGFQSGPLEPNRRPGAGV